MNTKQQFKANPLGPISTPPVDFGVLETAAKVAARSNIGDMVRPNDAAGQGATPDAGVVTIPDKPRRKGRGEIEQKVTIQKRLSNDVPDYLLKALKKHSAENDVTIRFIVMNALKKDNFPVRDDDLYQDARRA